MWSKKYPLGRRRTVRSARWSWFVGVSFFALVVVLFKLLAPGMKVAEYSLIAFYGGRRSNFHFRIPAQVWSNLNLSLRNFPANNYVGNPNKSASDGLQDLLNYVDGEASTRSSERQFSINHVPNYRVVHLDFKGARPKLRYLKAVLPMMKKAGANALLVEYEDSFPFTGKLANLSATNAFTESELREFLSFASDVDLEIIPLVQSFGHLEYALKLNEFAQLREIFEEPQDLCPTQTAGFELIKEIVAQVMSYHQDSKYLHIGCDEVFNLAKCDKCRAKIAMARKVRYSEAFPAPVSAAPPTANERTGLYLEHVVKIASFAKSKYDVQPLIWDDLLRRIPEKILASSKVAEVVEPVIWVYSTDFEQEFASGLWSVYARVFPRIWGASAFKGASSPGEYAPNIYERVVNNLAWQRVITSEDRYFKAVSGLVFTGWSRFDHFATLCELLPNSLPSLLLNLLLISRGSGMGEVASVFHEILSCPDLVLPPLTLKDLEGNPRLWQLRKCGFPGIASCVPLNDDCIVLQLRPTGADVVELTWNYQGVKLQTDAFVRSISTDAGRANAWLSDYNLKHNSTSRRRTLEALVFLPQVKTRVEKLEHDARKTLGKYFDTLVVQEWIEQRVYPLIQKLRDVERRGNQALQVTTWKRRSFS